MDETKTHYHFIGIGGIGVGTLACLVLAQGHTVTGSDLQENVMTRTLRARGAGVTIGHAAENVGGADWVVYSSAVRPDNPERTAALERGIPLLRRAELLARLMEKQTAVTVAGAHGKTTTTSMVTCLLMQAGLEPTCAVGGILNEHPYHAAVGTGRYFVAEVDESDGTFLYFKPHYSVVTNMDFEHVDHYQTWDNIADAYRQFLSHTRADGRIIACGDDARLAELVRAAGRDRWLYGRDAANDIRAHNIRPVEGQWLAQEFDCVFQQKGLGTFRLSVPGEHNVLNALACIGVGRVLGIPDETIKTCLAGYQGVQRRFQVKGREKDICVVDDYGHHPTEIAATLKTALSLGFRRVWTVFQPHRHTRTHYLMEEFVRVLPGADRLVLTDIYGAGEPPIEGVSSQALYERLVPSMGERICYVQRDRVLDFLTDRLAPGDMVLTLGAGDIYRTGEQLLAYLRKRHEGVVG